MADALFEVPRLAAVYDPLDPDRSDLDVYAAVAVEFGAREEADLMPGPLADLDDWADWCDAIVIR